jgi:cell wall-associated NlpC family hydrolase
MVFRKSFPRALAAVATLGILSTAPMAQTRPRVTTPADNTEITCSIDDSAFVAATAVVESKPVSIEAKSTKPVIDVAPSLGMPRFQPLLLAAIDERLGTPYHWGSTGPRSYDCSGFVWSIYQSIGVDFERSSARTLYARFEVPVEGEQYKFGTLVFFNGLSHVGVVADEKGFYHASRHNGVVYATFEGYWGKHIDGFRRVPLPTNRLTD